MKIFTKNKDVKIYLNKKNILPKINSNNNDDYLVNNLTSVKVPYINCYYFNPIFNINEDIKIPVYITDYENSDYLYENNNKTFTVTTELNDVIKIHNFKIGDNIINLGKISSELNTRVFIKCKDNITNMESYELIIPIWIQDPKNHIIDDNNTYIMTENDLSIYNINNTDSKEPLDLINTRKGLSQFFKDKSNEGYRKIVLIKDSIFRMDYSTVSGDGAPIIIPENMTIDMNNSTFRMNPESEYFNSGIPIVTNNGNDNTCLENGTLQGSYKYDDSLDGDDWDTFPFKNEEGVITAESAGSYNFSGGKYNTLRNIVVKNIEGYSITANAGSDLEGVWYGINTNTCKSCYIKNGIEIEHPKMMTTNYIKIPESIKNKGFLCFNRFKGYAGYKGRDGLEFFSWYDIDKNYIKTVKGHQMRENRIPENAIYVRITLFYELTEQTSDNAFIQSLDLPTHINIENVSNYNTRTCAVTSSEYNFFRIYNCTFNNCGAHITPAWLDLEDGYEFGNNLFIDSCEVINSPSTIDCICQYANNMVVENCKNISFSLAKCKNVTFKNNETSKTLVMNKPWMLYHGYRRVFNNILNGNTEFQSYEATNQNLQYPRIIKNNEIHGFIHATNIPAKLEKIIGGSIIDCVISGGIFENVIIESGKVNGTNEEKIFNNCIFNCSFCGNSVTTIKNSIFNSSTMISGNINDCVFNDNVSISGDCVISNCELTYNTRSDGNLTYGERFTDGSESVLIKNCTINYNASSGSLVGIGDQRNKYSNTHSTTFKNCTINMADGTNLVNGYYDLSQSWIATDIGYTVNFINCTINGNYIERGNRLVGYEDRYIINYI